MRLDLDGDQQITRLAAVRRLLALATKFDFLTILDAGRHLHVGRRTVVAKSQLERGSVNRIDEVDRCGHGHVSAALWTEAPKTTASTTATSEKVGKDILEACATATGTAAKTTREPGTVLAAGTAGKASTAAHGTNGVILFALFFVTNNAERFTDFFELGLGLGIARV